MQDPKYSGKSDPYPKKFMSDSQHWNARGRHYFFKGAEDRFNYQAWSKITIHATPPSSVVDPHYMMRIRDFI